MGSLESSAETQKQAASQASHLIRESVRPTYPAILQTAVAPGALCEQQQQQQRRRQKQKQKQKQQLTSTTMKTKSCHRARHSLQ
jgi:hypothetical protein